MHGHDNSRHGNGNSHGFHGGGRRRGWLKCLGVLAVVILAGAALGWVVTALWNWLMPTLFGFAAITFWQALGLFLLGRILIGGLRGYGGHGHRRHRRMHERWEQMTAEERESFSRGLRHRCGWGHGRSDAEGSEAGTSANPGNPAP